MDEPNGDEPFRLIDHTGDIGFVVDGRTIEELFERSARALFSIIADVSNVEERLHREVEVEGLDLEETLVAFLGELLYIHEVEDLVFRRVEVRSGPTPSLRAAAFGEKFDPERHRILRQIKAVTYHALRVEHTGESWQGQVILDI